MKIGILHLSDIHFRKEQFEKDSCKEAAEKICAAVKTELIGSTHVLLLVSGDIAFSGMAEEYECASDWFSELYTHIDDTCDATCWILFAPGNHDVDHSENRKIRTALLDQIRKDPTLCSDQQVIDECTKEQGTFFQFIKEMETDDILVYDNTLLRIHRIRDDMTEVQINILNSAWMSSLNETQGSIVYPIDNFKEQLSEHEGFTITVLHHPLGWFQTDNSRKLRDELSRLSSIVFFGHEHVPDSTHMTTSFGDHVKFVDGGVLDFEDEGRNNSFNLVLLETDECKIKNLIFEKIADRYESGKHTDWQDATKLTSVESNQFRLITQRRNEIGSIGINLLHPRRDQLLLRDLFVYPDLLPIKKASSSYDELDRMISAERLIFEQNSSHVILEGEDGSGKTALLRMLFSDFYKRGKIPLYIQGSKINSRSVENIRISLRRAFEDTYEREDFVQYEQIGSSDRIILVDDFQFSRKNPKAHERVLKFIKQFSDKSIVITRDFMPLEHLISRDKETLIWQGYDPYIIQEFGHLKRDELIKRWLLLGRQHDGENTSSFLYERKRARTVINTTIGKNFMPSYPITILVILQSIETISSNEVGSTYGHHYQFLITRSLMSCGVRSEDLDAFSNYISEFSYYLFSKPGNTRTISSDQYENWHAQFCSDYGVEWRANEIRSKLEKGEILIISSTGSVSFKYNYIFYFFLAKNFSRRLTDQNIRNIVHHMCSRLHITKYSNIILFLIHHSNDQFVLDSAREAASLLMQKQNLFRFETSKDNILLEMINQLPSVIIKPLLEERDPEEVQRRELEYRDIAEAEEVEDHLQDEADFVNESMDTLDILAQANIAAKTVDLLGQILKNYYGSLPLDTKVVIGKDTIELALRALYSYIDSFSSDNFQIIEFLKELRRNYETENLGESYRKDDQDLERWGRDFLFHLCSLLAVAIIQKTARAIGSNQIKPTLSKLVSENDSIGYQMVEIAVLLDSPSEIPRRNIESMVRCLNNNALGFQILRDLVAQRVYRYPTNIEDKQWIASKLNFSLAKQLYAELHKSRRILPR